MTTLEKTIETYLVEQIELNGGQCLKWVGRKGVPDRLVFMNGVIVPVELKSPTGVLADHQKRMHKKLFMTGNPVEVISEKSQVDGFVRQLQLMGMCDCAECQSLRAGALN